MPNEVASIEQERNTEIADVDSRKEGLGKQMRVIQTCTRTLAVVLGGITMTACPPAVIFLPFALDLVTLVEEAFRTRLVKKIGGEFPFAFKEMRNVALTNWAVERELHIQRCEDALQMLKSVAEFLSQLEECITKFIMFWLRIEEMVRGVKDRIGDLVNLPEAWSIRLELAKMDWEEAATAYRDYIVMVCGFNDN
jgi:hypothetical protein